MCTYAPDIPISSLSHFKIVVFGVTATFSIFAYVWLLIILKWNTEDEVDLWEAILTFAFFPILVLIAYGADKGWLNYLACKKPNDGPAATGPGKQIELGTFQPGESTYRVPICSRRRRVKGMRGMIRDVSLTTFDVKHPPPNPQTHTLLTPITTLNPSVCPHSLLPSPNSLTFAPPPL